MEDGENHSVKNRVKCKNIIYDTGRDVFNTLNQNINNLRILSYQLAAIIISTISIVGGLLTILIQTPKISSMQLTLSIPLKWIILPLSLSAIILGFVSSILCLRVMSFKEYKELNVFEEDYEILRDFCENDANEEMIYEHFQEYLKKSYDYNKKKYEEELKTLRKAMILFTGAFITLLMIIGLSYLFIL